GRRDRTPRPEAVVRTHRLSRSDGGPGEGPGDKEDHHGGEDGVARQGGRLDLDERAPYAPHRDAGDAGAHHRPGGGAAAAPGEDHRRQRDHRQDDERRRDDGQQTAPGALAEGGPRDEDGEGRDVQRGEQPR